MDSRAIAADFRTRIERAGAEHGFSVNGHEQSKSFLVLSGRRNCVVYFKVRSQKPYKWGVTKNQLEWLKGSGLDWKLVLLYESPGTGYLLTAADVERHIGDSIWPLGKDGDYKPASGTYLQFYEAFNSFDEFVNLLLASAASETATVSSEESEGERGLSSREFASQQAKRAETGRKGEEYVVEVERAMLARVGKKALASRVKQVSKENVAAGYDVLSFFPDGREKYIEVKAASGKLTTFEITRGEVEAARRLRDAYWLYLVENAGNKPAVQERIQDPAQQMGGRITLEPSVYTGRIAERPLVSSRRASSARH
jgi:hypothetical protein